MPKPAIHHFHLRLPSDLAALLMEEKGEKSLTKEILDRLRGSTGKDEASQIAELLRPMLDKLGEAERREMVQIVMRAAEILAQSSKKKRARSKSRISKA